MVSLSVTAHPRHAPFAIPSIGFADLSILLQISRADGYVTRFGVTYVDYETQKRYPKDSGKFLAKVSPRDSSSLSLLFLVLIMLAFVVVQGARPRG